MSSTVIRYVILGLLASPAMQAAPDFEKQVLPILTAKCLDCHQAPYEDNGRMKNPKAGLRLDAAWAIVQGGDNGKILEPGDAEKSQLYVVTTLDKDDDLFMPPKGEPLTKKEQALLKDWIVAGADFGSWEGNLQGKPMSVQEEEAERVRDHEVFYARLAEGVSSAPDAEVKKAKEEGAQLFLLKSDGPLLRADFLTGVAACDDGKLAVLLPLKEQIAQLDLGRTVVTDAGMATVAKLGRLASLDLRQTGVTDAGLAALKPLKNLRSLNLYGTKVSDAGLEYLAGMKELRQLYLWQTRASEGAAKKLEAKIPGLKVVIK
jgi:hypothetical protein